MYTCFMLGRGPYPGGATNFPQSTLDVGNEYLTCERQRIKEEKMSTAFTISYPPKNWGL